MKLVLSLILTVTFSFAAKKKAPLKLTRDQKLMLLIKKEEETINAVKKPSARLFYRKFELQNEKLKIIAREENQIFLKAKVPDKDGFFKKTKKQYQVLKNYAYSLKKIKGHVPYLAPTFFSLSQNCRDFKFEDKELFYLNKALKTVRNGTELKYNILVSKAEYLYNDKKYDQSYNLYRRIIKNDEDQWYTKNLYNYAWTQFKTHKFDDGILSLEKGYLLSKEERYVDFREQIINSLIIFYITHKRIQDAIRFILEQEKDPISSLFKLARKSSKKGFYNETNQVIKLLYERIEPLKKKVVKKGEANPFEEKIVELKVFELEHYREFNKRDLFYNTVQSLEKHKISEDYSMETIDYITTEVSDLQQILKKGFNERERTYDKKVLELCLYYFKRLRFYDVPNKTKYFFYSAETLFSVREHKRSISFYKNAISKKDEFDLNRKSIDALYVAIEEAKLKKIDYYKNLEYVYIKVVKLWPKEKDTKKVLVKLFNLYFTLKKHTRMDATILAYKKLFPEEIKAQKKLFEKQLDLLIKQKDVSLLSAKLDKVKKGFLSFDNKRAEQIEDILSTILFNQYKNLRKTGKNAEALKGYKSVFLKRDLTKKIKAQAALNIAIINTDLYNSNEILKWVNKTYKMDKNIYYKSLDIIISLADRTLLFHDFIGATNLYRYHLERDCKDHKRNNPIMKKLVSANIANAYTRKTLYYYNRYKNCSSEDNNLEMRSDIIAYLIDENDVSKTFEYLKGSTFSDKEKYAITEALFWKNKEDSSILSKVELYKDTHAKNFFMAKDSLEDLIKNTYRVTEFDTSFKKEMSPEKFNNHLNLFFSRVSVFLEKSKKVVNAQNKYFTLKALKHTEKILNVVKSKIDSIKSPILEPAFAKPFYAQMKQLSKGFNGQALEYKNTKINFMNDYNLLTDKIAFTVISRAPSAIKTIDLEK